MRGHDGAADFVATVLAGVGDTTIVVLDALAMQIVAQLDSVTRPLRGRLVLTPNRQELARLHDPDADVHVAADEQDADAVLRTVSARFGAVITSFGEIAAPDGRRWACSDGTPGLGTSGSGDVLAGLIGGAAARSGDAAQAACWGTYVHHEAGCRLSNRMGRLGFLARELLEEVPSLWADLEGRAR
jgi:NAD(P)H-hydrate repair Nnr-like enzyme with NAD(P)H-hydrate dehydratase domain